MGYKLLVHGVFLGGYNPLIRSPLILTSVPDIQVGGTGDRGTFGIAMRLDILESKGNDDKRSWVMWGR